MENVDRISSVSGKSISVNVAVLVLVMIGVLFLAACKSDSKNSEDSAEPIETQNIETMTTKENMDTTAPITYNEKIKDVPNATKNGVTGGNANIKYQTTVGSSGDWADPTQLYSDLEMTSRQIDEFQNAMHAYQKTLGGSNLDKSAGSIDVERAKHLKNILSDDQFEKFESINSNNWVS